jgi:RNA polymerase sigma-70 factor (ECF subfamily)
MSLQTALQPECDLDCEFLDTDSLYRKYHDTVTRWAHRLIRSASDAEDVAQEVFLVVQRRRGDYTRLQNPASWLYRITANIVRHRWRDQQRHGAVDADSLAELPDHMPSPLDDLERRRELEMFDRALGSLTEQQRELLLMWDVRRLATSDISAMTGVKAETLRVRRFRARLLITRRLRELEGAQTATQMKAGLDDFRALDAKPANYNEEEFPPA